jgi:hypothetical protein
MTRLAAEETVPHRVYIDLAVVGGFALLAVLLGAATLRRQTK